MFQELSETRFREAFNRKLTPPAPPSPPPQARRDRIKGRWQIQTKTFSFSRCTDETREKLSPESLPFPLNLILNGSPYTRDDKRQF
jgi:hypothetical protein